ncbi:MAG: hypothetical protein MZV64_34260 [Ignavibacteriales bacterium]|nr:hypothetical protein [Ignavibacteriales bacterium]
MPPTRRPPISSWPASSARRRTRTRPSSITRRSWRPGRRTRPCSANTPNSWPRPASSG